MSKTMPVVRRGPPQRALYACATTVPRPLATRRRSGVRPARQDLDDGGAPAVVLPLRDVPLDLAADLEVQARQLAAEGLERHEQRGVARPSRAEPELRRRVRLQDERAAGAEARDHGAVDG